MRSLLVLATKFSPQSFLSKTDGFRKFSFKTRMFALLLRGNTEAKNHQRVFGNFVHLNSSSGHSPWYYWSARLQAAPQRICPRVSFISSSAIWGTAFSTTVCEAPRSLGENEFVQEKSWASSSISNWIVKVSWNAVLLCCEYATNFIHFQLPRCRAGAAVPIIGLLWWWIHFGTARKVHECIVGSWC